MARKKKQTQSDADKAVLERAKNRFKRCQEWESEFRQRFRDDMKFLYADSDNQEQWPAAVRAQRQLESRPMLTVNKTHTHWLHVVNQGRENKASIKVIATGGLAPLFKQHTDVIDLIAPELTLEGLRVIYDLNSIR